LREIVTELIDFERLRAECRLKLYIATTQVRPGKLRLFDTKELSVEALLASTRLPSWHNAVVINGEAYWDGGYTGTGRLPPVLQLRLFGHRNNPSKPTQPAGCADLRSRDSAPRRRVEFRHNVPARDALDCAG
jgi:hypothetical protein